VSWERVNVGSDAEGAGNSDVDLAIARDGTLYYISMVYDRQKDEGTQIAIGSSADAGATWRWKTISKTRGDDRPWIEVAPSCARNLERWPWRFTRRQQGPWADLERPGSYSQRRRIESSRNRTSGGGGRANHSILAVWLRIQRRC
jgi:hypothetical protein